MCVCVSICVYICMIDCMVTTTIAIVHIYTYLHTKSWPSKEMKNSHMRRGAWHIMKQEVSVLLSFQPAHIIPLRGFSIPSTAPEEEANNPLCLVCDLAVHGSLDVCLLDDAIALRMPWPVRLRMARGLISTLITCIATHLPRLRFIVR